MRFRNFYPFWIVFSIELFFILYLILGHRGVIGHDAFAYFSLQYSFLNNAVNAGESAQWMPFLAHGFVANWWYTIQAGILQNALLGFGSLNAILRGSNFLPVYYIGILFDQTIFALGACLLSRRYFQSKLTILFVGIATAGSVSWFTTVFSNLHFYFALPLILHLIHCFFEAGKWRYFLLAGNLFAVQSLGDAPYFVPFLAFVVALYTAAYLFFFREKTSKEVRVLLLRWPHAIAPVVLVLLSFLFVYACMTYGTDQIANYDVGRSPDGRNISLDSFLTYGTNSNLRWAEIVSRISPVLDYSLYFGYVALAFAGIAVFTRQGATFRMIACTTVILFLVSSSTPLASFLYYAWPGMQFFRHLSLTSTIVRMFLCFLAGFGFETVFFRDSKEGGHRQKVRMSIILLFAASAFLLKFSFAFYYARGLLSHTVFGNLPLDGNVFEFGYLPHELVKASLWCLCAAGFFTITLSGRVSPKRLAIAAILFEALDIYSFRMDLLHLRTVQLTKEEYDISQFQPIPYAARREPVDYATHPRGKNVPQKNYPFGDIFWSADLLTFADSPSNSGRTDSWLMPLDDFLRTYSGEAIRDLTHRPAAFRPNNPLAFPLNEPNAQKAAGVTEDKVQFFSDAHVVADDRKLSTMLASNEFSGDVLLISGSAEDRAVPVQAYERLHRPYEILRYSSNETKIRVARASAGDWLYYADCWHPFWSVRVNGKEVSYYKANLAYKAVKLEDGENIVDFRFNSPKLAFFVRALNWNALIWVFLPFYIAWRASSGPEPAILSDN